MKKKSIISRNTRGIGVNVTKIIQCTLVEYLSILLSCLIGLGYFFRFKELALIAVFLLAFYNLLTLPLINQYSVCSICHYYLQRQFNHTYVYVELEDFKERSIADENQEIFGDTATVQVTQDVARQRLIDELIQH